MSGKHQVGDEYVVGVCIVGFPQLEVQVRAERRRAAALMEEEDGEDLDAPMRVR
jgi:hypothetical protein